LFHFILSAYRFKINFLFIIHVRSSFGLVMGQEEWLELESDPGLFTLLVEDLGVRGVQVDEIYELSKVPTDPVFGFIFLFRWQQNEKRHNSRRSSRGGTGSLNNSQTSSIGGVDISLNLSSSAENSATNNNNNNICSISSHQNGISPKIKSEFPTADSSDPEVFFAHQIVPNSCATHSLLSILMNTYYSGVDLGPLLSEFRRATASLSPGLRGLAIGYMPPLMEAHNRHARQQISLSQCLPPSCDEAMSISVVKTAVEAAQKASSSDSENGTNGSELGHCPSSLDDTSGLITSTAIGDAGDTFHFVCFLPVGKYLYELDGLKHEPINHGLLEDPIEHNGWTRQCLDLLKQRMRDQDVRYNLMAVVPDRRMALNSRLDNLKKNQSILERTIQKLCNSNATAIQVQLEHNGSLEAINSTPDINGSPEPEDAQEQQENNTETESEDTNVENSEGVGGEVGLDGRPLTRAACRAAAAAVRSKLLKRSTSLTPSKKSSLRGFASSAPSPSSICIDLTEDSSLSGSNNNAFAVEESSEGVTTRRKGSGVKEQAPPAKYPTRSSTRRDTLASHSLANSNRGINEEEGTPSNNISSTSSSTTTAFLTTDDLSLLLASIEAKARACSSALVEEEARRQSYRVDAARRIHNYEPFIRAFLKELKEHGMLQKLVGEANANGNSGSSNGRQLRKRRRVINSSAKLAQKSTNWSASSASGSTSTTSSLMSAGNAGDGISAAGRAIKRARLTAVSANNRPSTRMSTMAGSSIPTSPSSANRRRTPRRPL
uniref:ubiquitinyl hydrolase 1 n=1 Tax=Hymenolepis diminuta TaxID=6216 RepID=A0A158QF42_HYMDI